MSIVDLRFAPCDANMLGEALAYSHRSLNAVYWVNTDFEIVTLGPVPISVPDLDPTLKS